MTQSKKGALYMILSALCFASMQVVVRLSREIPHDGADLHAEFVRADRFGDYHSAQKGLAVWSRPKYQPYLFGRSFFGFLGLITLFYASSHAAQGDVTILNKNFPLSGSPFWPSSL